MKDKQFKTRTQTSLGSNFFDNSDRRVSKSSHGNEPEQPTKRDVRVFLLILTIVILGVVSFFNSANQVNSEAQNAELIQNDNVVERSAFYAKDTLLQNTINNARHSEKERQLLLNLSQKMVYETDGMILQRAKANQLLTQEEYIMLVALSGSEMKIRGTLLDIATNFEGKILNGVTIQELKSFDEFDGAIDDFYKYSIVPENMSDPETLFEKIEDVSTRFDKVVITDSPIFANIFKQLQTVIDKDLDIYVIRTPSLRLTN